MCKKLHNTVVLIGILLKFNLKYVTFIMEYIIRRSYAMKEKITNVLNKIKENKRIILKTTISVLVVFIFAFSFYNLNNPTYFNKLLASIGDKPTL